MIRREKGKKYEFSLINSLESLINQSVWGWGRVLSFTQVLENENSEFKPVIFRFKN